MHFKGNDDFNVACWMVLCQVIIRYQFCGNNQGVRRGRKYLHKKEASTDMVRYWTHPDVPVFLQIFRCDNC